MLSYNDWKEKFERSEDYEGRYALKLDYAEYLRECEAYSVYAHGDEVVTSADAKEN